MTDRVIIPTHEMPLDLSPMEDEDGEPVVMPWYSVLYENGSGGSHVEAHGYMAFEPNEHVIVLLSVFRFPESVVAHEHPDRKFGDHSADKTIPAHEEWLEITIPFNRVISIYCVPPAEDKPVPIPDGEGWYKAPTATELSASRARGLEAAILADKQEASNYQNGQRQPHRIVRAVTQDEL